MGTKGSAEDRQKINMLDRRGRRITPPLAEITVERQVRALFGGGAGPAAQPLGGQRRPVRPEPPGTRTGDHRGAGPLERVFGDAGGVRAEQPPAADRAALVLVEGGLD